MPQVRAETHFLWLSERVGQVITAGFFLKESAYYFSEIYNISVGKREHLYSVHPENIEF
jgi:hypothetical protein